MVILGILLLTGCRGPNDGDTPPGTLVKDMSSGPVELIFTLQPDRVELNKDVMLQIAVTVPSEIDVQLPPLADRLTGFVLNGTFDHEPYSQEGKTLWTRNVRLTPVISDEYRIAPMSITYVDKSKSPALHAWFATRPLVLESVAPTEGPAPDEITPVFEPVWIAPSPTSVVLWVFLLGVVLLLFLLTIRLLKKVRRQIQLRRMSPRGRALAELAELLAKDLIARNLAKQFYIEFTMIVRNYIERQHSVRAPEQTTEEFLEAASRDPRFTEAVLEKLRAFLEAADLVKFARHLPGNEAVANATDTAEEYIRTDHLETKHETLNSTS